MGKLNVGRVAGRKASPALTKADKIDWNAPIPGQAAAIVAITKDGPYLGRFPYAIAGGRDAAHAAADRWRYEAAPGAQIFGFTGRVRLIWDDDDA